MLKFRWPVKDVGRYVYQLCGCLILLRIKDSNGWFSYISFRSFAGKSIGKFNWKIHKKNHLKKFFVNLLFIRWYWNKKANKWDAETSLWRRIALILQHECWMALSVPFLKTDVTDFWEINKGTGSEEKHLRMMTELSGCYIIH